MAVKVIAVPGIGPVTFQKRSNTSSIRIHIQGSKVKVTMPHRVPYAYAERFVGQRQEWVQKHLAPVTIIGDGAYIGKQHRVAISYRDTSRPSSRIKGTIIAITLPNGLDVQSPDAQRIITKACEKALAQETNELVAPRLQDLAYEHGFEIKEIMVKRLRSRWGSCDNHKNITLNSYLAQLPWPLIDYVLVHELAHTKHLNHGAEFWGEVANVLPDYKARRKETKTYAPHVITT